jgi:hypothetical protein
MVVLLITAKDENPAAMRACDERDERQRQPDYGIIELQSGGL